MARQRALLGRDERSTPKARRVAPEARGVDGEGACRATMGVAIAPRVVGFRVKVDGSRDDLRRACQVVARFGATTLYSVDPRGIRTMTHSCASTARLLGGGPILTSGIEAMEFSGLPPPRTISDVTRGPRSFCCLLFLPNHSCRWTQHDAGWDFAGRRITPQCDQELAG
jgi:hypothetical protein